MNVFQPSFKLKEKRREEAKIIKRYHPPATPYERALAHPAVDKAIKRKLRELHRTLDPVGLLRCARPSWASALTGGLDRRSTTGTGDDRRKLPRRARRELGGWRAADHPSAPVRSAQAGATPPVDARPLYLPHRGMACRRATPHGGCRCGAAARVRARQFGGRRLRTLQRFVQCWCARTAKLLIDGETMITTVCCRPGQTAADQHVSDAAPR